MSNEKCSLLDAQYLPYAKAWAVPRYPQATLTWSGRKISSPQMSGLDEQCR